MIVSTTYFAGFGGRFEQRDPRGLTDRDRRGRLRLPLWKVNRLPWGDLVLVVGNRNCRHPGGLNRSQGSHRSQIAKIVDVQRQLNQPLTVDNLHAAGRGYADVGRERRYACTVDYRHALHERIEHVGFVHRQTLIPARIGLLDLPCRQRVQRRHQRDEIEAHQRRVRLL
jgi:hypothetical protein